MSAETGESQEKIARKSEKAKEKHNPTQEQDATSKKKGSSKGKPLKADSAQSDERVKEKKRRKEHAECAAGATETAHSADGAETEPAKAKKSKKSREEGVSTIEQNVVEDGGEKKRKKSRKGIASGEPEPALSPRHLVEEGTDGPGSEDADAEETDEKKEAEDASQSRKTRKSQREHRVDAPVEKAGEHNEGVTKEKKKRKRNAEVPGARDDETVAKEHKKKKRKHRSEYPDPNEDGSLSEQACKALHYAFAQFEDPATWKFNKARQNWLIRNIWSTQAIPDIYMPLLTRYLANAKGGVRDTLVKNCRDIVAPTPAAERAESVSPHQSSETQPSTDASTNAVIDEAKRARAVALLSALVEDTS